MTKSADPMSELYRLNLDAALKLAQLSIEQAQRVMALQNQLARKLVEESAAHARALADTQDAQTLGRLRAEFAQETARQFLAAAQQMAEVGQETRAAFARLLTEQLAAGSQEMADAMQAYLRNLPGPTPQWLDAMQHGMSALRQAFESSAASAAGETSKSSPGARRPRAK